jgi:hypothetical protein
MEVFNVLFSKKNFRLLLFYSLFIQFRKGACFKFSQKAKKQYFNDRH